MPLHTDHLHTHTTTAGMLGQGSASMEATTHPQPPHTPPSAVQSPPLPQAGDRVIKSWSSLHTGKALQLANGTKWHQPPGQRESSQPPPAAWEHNGRLCTDPPREEGPWDPGQHHGEADLMATPGPAHAQLCFPWHLRASVSSRGTSCRRLSQTVSSSSADPASLALTAQGSSEAYLEKAQVGF